jgi:hypothetical protein
MAPGQKYQLLRPSYEIITRSPLAGAALGLFISARLTVASTHRGVIAVNGQVGEELPPGGVRFCPAASATAGARFEFGFYRTVDGAFSWVGALDARTRASDCQADQKRYR